MSPVRFRSLSQIFALAVVLVSVPLVAGTVLSFFYIERLSSDSRDLVVRSLEIGRESERLNDHIEDLSRTAQQYVVVRSEEVYNLYTQKHVRLIDILDWLELLVEKEEARRVLQDIRQTGNAAFELVQRLRDNTDEEIDTAVFDRLAGLSGDLSFFSDTAIRNQLDLAAKRVETARWTLYWIWGISLVVVVALAMVFAWFIARPIRRMDSHIRRLGRGYFDEPIKIEGPTDIVELGDRLDWLRRRMVEVDRIKESFFREVSHQLKTPLASIREGTDLLMDQSGDMDPARLTEILELLHNNSMELQRMLENMLNFSAWRADPGHLHKERFRLRPLVENIVQRFRTLLWTHDIEARVECPDDIEVEMDREKCRIIMDNLISNAIKFSPEKGVVVVDVSSDQSRVRIDVSDQGPGIHRDHRERIFELFHLGNGQAAGSTRGSGIGLALVKAYVQAHDGEVSVDAGPDGGARFRVAIPRR